MNESKRKRWPFDASITIALFALLLSAIQFVVTAPLFTALLISPKLEIRGSGSLPIAETLTGTYFVANTGNEAATNVEIGMVLEMSQRLVFLPNLVTEVTEEEGAVLVKNVKVKIAHLLPDESFLITVVPGPEGEKLNSELAEFLISSGINQFPMISYIRSSEGQGKIHLESVEKNITSQSSSPAEKRGPDA